MGTPGGPRAWRRWGPALLIASALAQPAAAKAQGGVSEAAVKAAYLPKFAPFVQWPPPLQPGEGRPLVVCVLGTDPFGPTLDEIAARGAGDGTAVRVVRVTAAGEAGSCHVLYLAPRPGGVAAALDALAGAPVLTVTDQADGDGARGVVHFEVVGNRVRFHIDDRAAERKGLALSSKLLSLALSLTSAGGPP